jgi:hypothetical protein
MKKLLLFFSLFTTTLFSQQLNFFTPTTYRGAFDSAPTPMWTDGWANFDPQYTVYPTPTDVVSDSITTNTTWTSNKTYLVQGPLYVKANLTIQPGTIVLFDKSTAGSALIVTTKGKLFAEGLVNNPIVFTSNAVTGQRNIGDWGGIVLLGEAKNNLPANAASGTPAGIGFIEGLPTSTNTQYGGNNDLDISGILKYIRIEFGGYAYQPDKEINGITFGSVGSGTVVDFIQVSFTNDDAFEWFGGTVNAKHLVSYRNLDDDMDCDFGYRGNVQFALIVRDPQIADQSAGSTSEGFECDNDGSGSNNNPKTAATFSNVTAIGPLRGNTQSTIDPKHQRALRLRRNAEMKIFNSVFTDFRRGLHIDGASTEANAQLGTLKFKYNTIAGCYEKYMIPSVNNWNIRTWFLANSNDTSITTSTLLVSPYNYIGGDYRPSPNSVLLSGASFSDVELGSQSIGMDEFVSFGDFYPNPVNDVAVFPSNGVILDLTGRVVIKIVKGENFVGSLNTGVYVYKSELGTSYRLVKN